MSIALSNQQEIIMNFGCAPSLDDILTLARTVLGALPDELDALVDDLDVDVQDFPDEAAEQDEDIEDLYDLLALYRSAKEFSPGIEKKDAEGDDLLILYRRPILDFWCESGETFEAALRQIILEEIASQNDFSEDDIDEMVSRHHQGVL